MVPEPRSFKRQIKRQRLLGHTGRQVHTLNPMLDFTKIEIDCVPSRVVEKDGHKAIAQNLPIFNINNLFDPKITEPFMEAFLVDTSIILDHYLYKGRFDKKRGLAKDQKITKKDDLESVIYAPVWKSFGEWARGDSPAFQLRMYPEDDGVGNMIFNEQIFLLKVIYKRQCVKIKTFEKALKDGKSIHLKDEEDKALTAHAGNFKYDPKVEVVPHIEFQGLGNVYSPLRQYLTTMITTFDSLPSEVFYEVLDEYAELFKDQTEDFVSRQNDLIKSYTAPEKEEEKVTKEPEDDDKKDW